MCISTSSCEAPPAQRSKCVQSKSSYSRLSASLSRKQAHPALGVDAQVLPVHMVSYTLFFLAYRAARTATATMNTARTVAPIAMIPPAEALKFTQLFA